LKQLVLDRMLSLTKSWIITERHLTQYLLTVRDYTGHHQTLLSAWETNLKACTSAIRTQNLLAGPGIEPGSFWQSPEPPKQAQN